MKNALKILLYRFLGKRFYSLIRPFYTPSDSMKTRLRFIGAFQVTTRDGKAFYLYNNGFHLESHIYWSGLDSCNWEPMTRAIWTELSQSASTVFDIGANSGVFAVLAKVYSPRSRVVAFEPQPNVFAVLQKNNEINGFDIQCCNVALSNTEGEAPFYNYGPGAFTSENTTAGSLNSSWRTEDQASIVVKVKELKAYVAENHIKKIDLMKIDVETFEYEVLAGYGDDLYVHEPIVLLEVQNASIGRNISALFSSTSYSFFNIDETAGLRRVDALGLSEGNHNYVLCPASKLGQIRRFVA